MSLQRFSKILVLFLFWLSACSVYKSSGRKSFESKAPDNVQRLSASSLKSEALTDENADTCWNQPASEPLWHIDPNSTLNVSPLNNEEIQVCIQDL
jgi:hypothetical protein